jgi:serine/threonine-protein kinase
VLVGTDGATRVHDFGTAKAKGRIAQTRDGQVKGKLAYMAAEQVRGELVDARCDVYAAGAVLWELLTLERLIRGDSKEDMLEQILLRPLPSLREQAPQASPQLENVLLRALSRDARQRFPTARDMAIALEMAAPVARAREVGDWVKELAADNLAWQAGLLAKIEALPFASDAPPEQQREASDPMHELPTHVYDRSGAVRLSERNACVKKQ